MSAGVQEMMWGPMQQGGRLFLESGHGIATQQDFANFLFRNLAKKILLILQKKITIFAKAFQDQKSQMFRLK